MNRRTFEREIVALLDGELPPDRAMELHRMLREDRHARARYYEYVCLHQALDFRFHRAVPSAGFTSVSGLRSKGRRSIGITVIASLAAVLVAALLLRAFLIPEARPHGQLKAAADARFSIEHASGATSDANILAKGSSVKLDQGSLEITFAGGSRAVIQGPARFVLTEASHLRLDQGSAFFNVEKLDQDFTVTTGSLRVADRDAEFGIHAFADRSHEIHVIRGSVHADGLRGSGESVILRAGEARKTNTLGRLTPVYFDDRFFPDVLPNGLADFHLSFDESSGAFLPVEGSMPKVSRFQARYLDADGKPALPNLIPGRIGRAIEFKGDGDHVETDWPGFSGNLARSVSFWTKVSAGTRFTHMPAVANWGAPSGAVGKWKVLIAQENASQAAVARISFGLIAYDGSTPLSDGRWHHVVAVFGSAGTVLSSGGFAIYVDGRPETLVRQQFAPSSSIPANAHPDTQTDPDQALPLLIGLSVDPRPGSFPGLIDELRIHAGALDQEAVLRLHQGGNGR